MYAVLSISTGCRCVWPALQDVPYDMFPATETVDSFYDAVLSKTKKSRLVVSASTVEAVALEKRPRQSLSWNSMCESATSCYPGVRKYSIVLDLEPKKLL